MPLKIKITLFFVWVSILLILGQNTLQALLTDEQYGLYFCVGVARGLALLWVVYVVITRKFNPENWVFAIWLLAVFTAHWSFINSYLAIMRIAESLCLFNALFGLHGRTPRRWFQALEDQNQ